MKTYWFLLLVTLVSMSILESCVFNSAYNPNVRNPNSSTNSIEGKVISAVIIETSGAWLKPDDFKKMIKSKAGTPFSESRLRRDMEIIHNSGYAKDIVVSDQLIGNRVEIRIQITISDPM
jgi:outer membrane protein assembly factor BamA